MVDLHSIRDAAILNGLTESDLEKIGAIGSQVAAEQGERLFARATPSDTLLIILEGKFALTVMLRAAGDDVEVAIEALDAGDALGWSSLVPPHQSVYSAYCTERGSVAALDRRDMENLFANDAGLGYRWMRNVSELVGRRVRHQQQLWIEEVEQSMSRVMFWTQQKVCTNWTQAVVS